MQSLLKNDKVTYIKEVVKVIVPYTNIDLFKM
jgi:hypothetical protein